MLRQLVLALAAAMDVIGMSETLIFPIVERGLNRSPTFLGVWSVIMGVGAVTGGVTATWLGRRIGDTRLVGVGLSVAAAASLVETGAGFPDRRCRCRPAS